MFDGTNKIKFGFDRKTRPDKNEKNIGEFTR